MITKINAILSLRPGSEWVLRDDELEWLDLNTTTPTEAEIQTEVTRLQAEAEAAIQAQATAKQSALNKLMALGLTEEEALALGVK